MVSRPRRSPQETSTVSCGGHEGRRLLPALACTSQSLDDTGLPRKLIREPDAEKRTPSEVEKKGFFVKNNPLLDCVFLGQTCEGMFP